MNFPATIPLIEPTISLSALHSGQSDWSLR